MKTASETFFEEYCQRKGIRWKRIEESDVCTPDYDIYVPRRKVVVEVKEIALNEDEKTAQRMYAERGFSSGRITPGHRVRKKISEASPQIKSRTRSRYPGLLVLFDRGFMVGHLDPYHIRVAMYGFETVQFAVPRDPRIDPHIIGARYGAKRKMTPEHNTSISAIGVLHTPNRSSIELAVYHNMYAGIPLAPEALGKYGIPQFRIEESVPGCVPQWEQIEALSKP